MPDSETPVDAIAKLVWGACHNTNAPKLVFGDTIRNNGMSPRTLSQICNEIGLALREGTDLQEHLELETSDALHPAFLAAMKKCLQTIQLAGHPQTNVMEALVQSGTLPISIAGQRGKQSLLAGKIKKIWSDILDEAAQVDEEEATEELESVSETSAKRRRLG